MPPLAHCRARRAHRHRYPDAPGALALLNSMRAMIHRPRHHTLLSGAPDEIGVGGSRDRVRERRDP